MSVLSHAHALARLQTEHSAWKLLKADLAPVLVSVLDARLGGETRRIESEELYELIDADLDDLRAHGFVLPGTARAYCSEWRAAGYLVRRPAEASRGETFELSASALTAIRFLAQLARPRQTATESRLAGIAGQLRQLAVDSDPDAVRRIERLEAQRTAIDAEIDAINRGESRALDRERGLERIRDIVALAEDIPSDFARVRGEFEDLNRDLRARVIESDEAQREVLDEIFRGVDLIDQSEAGRSFSSFSSLVLDPERGQEVEEDIRSVLERDFAADLSAADRKFLRRLLRTLKARSSEIHGVVTVFARGLRRYVQSQDFERDRVLRRELRDALAAAHTASAHIKPFSPTEAELELSAVQLRSVGAIHVHDPSANDAPENVVAHVAETVSLEVLRAIARETEIDFTELTRNINTLLSEHRKARDPDGETIASENTDEPAVTVREVLDAFPATQGVASVAGLLLLGAQQGAPTETYEIICWTGLDGVRRQSRVPGYRFTRRVL